MDNAQADEAHNVGTEPKGSSTEPEKMGNPRAGSVKIRAEISLNYGVDDSLVN